MKTSAKRVCAFEGCDVLYDDFGASPNPWPRAYCSAACHRAARSAARAPEKPRTPLRASSAGERPRRPVSAASAAQRAKRGACIVCGETRTDAAHVIDRSLALDDDDDSRAVVSMCRDHHSAYDEGRLDILPFLEPYFRAELGFAVEGYGLLRTLERVTNQRWVPMDDERKAA